MSKSLGWILIDRETKTRLSDKIFDTKEEVENEIADSQYPYGTVANEVFY